MAIKYKKGMSVTVLVKGEVTNGKIVEVRDVEGNGQWIDVNIGVSGKAADRVIKSCRPKAVTVV